MGQCSSDEETYQHTHILLFMLLGNAAKASEILAELDKGVPGIIVVKLRRINLERRRGNINAVSALYEEAMIETSDQELGTFFAVRYARFLSKVLHDVTFLFVDCRRGVLPAPYVWDTYK